MPVTIPKRPLIGSAAVLLALIVFAGVWLFGAGGLKPRVRLPNGQEIVVESVTSGHFHKPSSEPLWARVFPTTWLPQPVTTLPTRRTREHALIVWTTERAEPTSRHRRLRRSLLDEHGCVF